MNGVWTKWFGIIDQTVYLYLRTIESQQGILIKMLKVRYQPGLKIEIAKYFALEINCSLKQQ